MDKSKGWPKEKHTFDYCIFIKHQWFNDDEEINRVFKLAVTYIGSACTDVEIAELGVHIKNIMTKFLVCLFTFMSTMISAIFGLIDGEFD